MISAAIKNKKKTVKLEFGIYSKDKPNSNNTVVHNPSPPIATFPKEKQILKGSLDISKFNKKELIPLDANFKKRILDNLSNIHKTTQNMTSAPVVDAANGELMVSFDFSKKLVERFKGLDKCERAWDPELKCWRVFVGSFDEVFDILGKRLKLTSNAYGLIQDFIDTEYYSYIAKSKLGKLIIRESWFKVLNVSDDENTESDNHYLIDELSEFPFKRQPLQHQLIGISYLYKNRCAGLFDEMGCGKTFQIVNTILLLLRNSLIKNAVVFVPKSLLYTWQNEFMLSGLLDFTIVNGSPKEREKALKNPHNVIVSSYETMKIEKEKFIEFLKSGDSLIVFDESQKLKNINADVTKAALTVRQNAVRCVISTGTPITNRPIDLFAQYLVMDRGSTFGTNFDTFKNTFCNMETRTVVVNKKKIQIEKFISVRNSETLNTKVKKTSLRRLKSDVLDLPNLVYKDFIVEMKSNQLKMYKDEVKRFKQATLNPEGSSSISHHMLKLNQLSSNPKLIDKSYDGCNAKVEELKIIVEDLFTQENKKTIIWTHYVDNVQMLKDHFETYSDVAVHMGEMSLRERNTAVDNFCNNPDCKIFIATVQSAKEGLTLLPRDGKSVLDTMIYFDLDFDAGAYIQSQARFHRIGQTSEKCLIIHLLAKDSIDFYIKKNIFEKIETSKDVLVNTKSFKIDENFYKNFTHSLI